MDYPEEKIKTCLGRTFDFHWEDIHPSDMFQSYSQCWTLKAFTALRALFAAYTTVLLIVDAIINFEDGTWFTYFTHMNYTILATYFVMGSIMSYRRIGRPKFLNRRVMASSTKTLHLLGSVEFVNALFLDIVYWTLLYDPAHPPSFVTCNMHGSNFVMMLIDILLSKMILIWQHGWLNLVFAVLFIVFAQIYHAFSDHWVYPFLDTSKSLWPISYICVTLLLIVIFSVCKLIIHIRNRVGSRGELKRDLQSQLMDDYSDAPDRRSSAFV
eukprot:TRINITY_DN28743_c0_g1_i1.p1 TRINITY_DN28743_c0_g1~~TRINITY_DN28743_c0_g1_i1.p1  ORF type:complete len:269 (+),score=36.61 TRINITY_DN28743_c0_g1_i1:227-1033(+)